MPIASKSVKGKQRIADDSFDFLLLPKYETDIMSEVRVKGGDGLLSSDWHVPLTDPRIVVASVREARRRKATDWLVGAGDIFNFDVLSDYLPKQSDHSLNDEIRIARKMLKMLLGVFDHVYITMGNHDIRLQKRLGYTLKFEDSMELVFAGLGSALDRVTFTGRDYVIVESDEGPYRVAHTRDYRKGQLSVASEVADIHRCHTFVGHAHHHAIGHSKSGYRIGDLGGWFNSDKTSYLKRWTSTHPRWQPGDFILKNGVPYSRVLSG